VQILPNRAYNDIETTAIKLQPEKVNVMEALLVSVLIICLVCGILWYAIQFLPENPFKRIASVAVIVFGVVFIVIKLLALV